VNRPVVSPSTRYPLLLPVIGTTNTVVGTTGRCRSGCARCGAQRLNAIGLGVSTGPIHQIAGGRAIQNAITAHARRRSTGFDND
jgi:hypothetical protein